MAAPKGLRAPSSNVDPGEDGIPWTKSDTLDLLGNTFNANSSPIARALYVDAAGSTGTIVVTTAAGNKRTFAGLITGTTFSAVRIQRLWSTGTDATVHGIVP